MKKEPSTLTREELPLTLVYRVLPATSALLPDSTVQPVGSLSKSDSKRYGSRYEGILLKYLKKTYVIGRGYEVLSSYQDTIRYNN